MPFLMKALILIFMLGLILRLNWLNKRDPQPFRRFAMISISLLAVLFCALEPILGKIWGKKDQLNNLSLRAQAFKIGATASSLKSGIKSAIVIVDKKTLGTRLHEQQLESLIEGLKVFALDLKVFAANHEGAQVSGSEFAGILKQAQNVDLIVSFVGLPGGDDIGKVPRFVFDEEEEEEKAEKPQGPMIAVVLPMLDAYAARLLKNGRIDMASINQVDMIKARALTPKSPLSQYYDAMFVMLTGANLLQTVKAQPSLIDLASLKTLAEKNSRTDKKPDDNPELLLDEALPQALPLPKKRPELE
ncbi:MAG: hypothetical protein RL095_774 [Verrucomicrobiota bacterium]|jgi:hypothetical protein